MCLYPKLIKNRKYTSTKKNGGIIPAILDERTKYVPIGCQECLECRKQKSRDWQCRLLEDIKTHRNGKFVTLTFSNEQLTQVHNAIKQNCKENNLTMPEGYELDNQIATYAIRHFLENWRKEFGKSLRHWLVTELGHNGTENIHIHGIIWTDYSILRIEKKWKYGFIWKGKKIREQIVNYVNSKTVNYIIKYVNKIDEKHRSYKSKIFTTAGIGHNYTATYNATTNKFKETETQETYRTETGHKISLPIYWRNKIYTEQQREKLWLQKLDKQERWICGEKVDIKNGEETYWKLLKYYQTQNRQLGYGDGTHTWEQRQYEKELRMMNQHKRINNTNNLSTSRIKARQGDANAQNPRKTAIAPPLSSKGYGDKRRGQELANPSLTITEIQEKSPIINTYAWEIRERIHWKKHDKSVYNTIKKKKIIIINTNTEKTCTFTKN